MADVDPNFPPARWPSYWNELTSKGSLTFETRHKAKDGPFSRSRLRAIISNLAAALTTLDLRATLRTASAGKSRSSCFSAK